MNTQTMPGLKKRHLFLVSKDRLYRDGKLYGWALISLLLLHFLKPRDGQSDSKMLSPASEVLRAEGLTYLE